MADRRSGAQQQFACQCYSPTGITLRRVTLMRSRKGTPVFLIRDMSKEAFFTRFAPIECVTVVLQAKYASF